MGRRRQDQSWNIYDLYLISINLTVISYREFDTFCNQKERFEFCTLNWCNFSEVWVNDTVSGSLYRPLIIPWIVVITIILPIFPAERRSSPHLDGGVSGFLRRRLRSPFRPSSHLHRPHFLLFRFLRSSGHRSALQFRLAKLRPAVRTHFRFTTTTTTRFRVSSKYGARHYAGKIKILQS